MFAFLTTSIKYYNIGIWKSNLYQAALALALTIPDICGAYQYPQSQVGFRYKKWFDEYVPPYYMPKILGDPVDSKRKIMTGDICYCLRCAVLHSGNDDINAKARTNFLSDVDTGYKVLYNFILTTDHDSMECITHRPERNKRVCCTCAADPFVLLCHLFLRSLP